MSAPPAARATPAVEAAPTPAPRWTVADTATIAALAILSAVIRWPYLTGVPRVTDEVDELSVGLVLFRGLEIPLTNDNAYIGPILPYVWAAAFSLFGASFQTGRGVMLVAGALTVLVTYLLGRELHSRTAGLAGAILLATNPLHVAINSHVAWSNSVTPLFVTAGLTLLVRALRHGAPTLPLLSGLAFGLALQTHISVLAMITGAAAAVVICRPGRLRSWLPVAWVVGLTLGYGNMIVFNLTHDWESLREAADVAARFNRTEPLTAAGFAERLISAVSSLVSVTSAEIGGTSIAVLTGSSLPWFHVSVLAVTIAVVAMRGPRIALVWLGVSLLVLVLVNRRYEGNLGTGRYVMPLFPVVAVLHGVALLALARWALRRSSVSARSEAILRHCLAGIPILLLATLSVQALAAYYRAAEAAGTTSAQIFQITDAIATSRSSGEDVVLDGAMSVVRTEGGGCYLNLLGVLLAMRDLPYSVLEARDSHLRDVRRSDGRILLAVRRERVTESPLTTRWVVWATNRVEPAGGRLPTTQETYYQIPRSDTRVGELPIACETERLHKRLGRQTRRD